MTSSPKRWLIGLALCLLLAASATASAPPALPTLSVTPLTQAKAPNIPVEIALQGSLPRYPERLMAYQIIYPRVDGRYVSDLAARLGMAGPLAGPPASGGLTLMALDGHHALEVYPETGAFWYKDTQSLWSGDKPGSPLDEASGAALASGRLRGWGLLPGGLLFEGMGHSQLTTYDVTTGQGETYVTDLHVTYRLWVGGLPVDGPGGKVKVYLGEGYNVIGIYWAGFQVKPLRAYPIIPPQSALEMLEAQGIATTLKNPRQATVTQVGLVYYAGPGNQAQAHLEPVYRFGGTIQGEGESRGFVQYVPAVPARYRAQDAVNRLDALPGPEVEPEERRE